MLSELYHGLDDKNVYSVYSLKVKFNVDLSFSEMRSFYSMKCKETYTHRQRKNIEELEGVHERNFENSKNLLSTFRLGKSGSSDNSNAFIEKRKQKC